MIKVEVVIDGDKVIVGGKEFTVVAEYGYDTVIIMDERDNAEYWTLEEAVNYCLEDHASNP